MGAVMKRECKSGGRVRHAGRPLSRQGFSLMEVMVVLTIMGVLIAMSAPTFHRAVEQSRADVAGANLRAIWSAQRLFWLENHAFASDLNQLLALNLVDPSVVTSSTVYTYSVAAADADTFTAVATRTPWARWSGELAIDQTGTPSGSITALGEDSIQPGFQ